MAVIFLGPSPMSHATAQADGQAALGRLSAVLRGADATAALHDQPSAPRAPGLYLLLEPPESPAARPRLVGLWIRFGPEYGASGPGPSADHTPPFAAELLEALTEELWWRTLPMPADAQGMAQLPLVLEWPPNLARRTELAPPEPEAVAAEGPTSKVATVSEELPAFGAGLPSLDDDDLDLAPAALSSPPVDPELTDPGWSPSAPPAQPIGPGRSLLTRVMLTLRHGARLHRASFALSSPPPDLGWPGWLGAPGVDPRGEAHALRGPLSFGDDGGAFTFDGWLTRGLAVWPPRPADVAAGAAPDRVLQNRQLGQLYQALALTGTVLLVVAGVSTSLNILARPRDKDRPSDPPLAPQPALSVCSAYHERYVEELRCQILGMTEESGSMRVGQAGPAPRCSDAADTLIHDPNLDSDVEVQALACGLADRAQDGWRGRLYPGEPEQDWLRLAAAQACFNVMGQPPNWALEGHPASVDVDKMLDPGARGIAPLVAVVNDLERGCEAWRPRIEGTVQGAVLDAQVGAPFEEWATRDELTSDAQRIRWTVTDLIARTLSAEQSRCLRTGARALSGARQLADLCASAAEVDGLGAPKITRLAAPDAAKGQIWSQLGGDAHEDSAITRYTRARFGDLARQAERVKHTVPLWQCHLDLLNADESFDAKQISGSWGIILDEPEFYPGVYHNARRAPAVRSQLELDALLTAAHDTSVGRCWTWISDALRTYTPAHPLVRELGADDWPSDEQQLCGQVCAVYYRVQDHDGTAWATPDADLALCLDRAASASSDHEPWRDALDTLGLPWSGASGWVTPTNTDICAFHLIAQEWFPQGRDGYVGYGQAGKSWAGETRTGSGLAGGADGLATLAIQDLMETASGSWSPSYCGYAAAECYTGLLLEATGSPGSRPFEWRRLWEDRVKEVNRMKSPQVAASHPWCVPFAGHLLDQGQASDDGVRAAAVGQGPCMAAVIESRERTTAALEEMIGRATGAVAESRAASAVAAPASAGGQP